MAIDSATSGFLYALGIGAVVAPILLLVFCLLRPKVTDVFYHRRLLNTWKSYDDFNGRRVGLTEPAPSDSFLGWLKPLFSTSEEQIFKKIGLDAVVFLRYIRSSLLIVTILALVSSVLLMPTYGTGPNKGVLSTDPNFVEGLRVISLGNVADKSARLWATVIMEFITAIVVVFFMTNDYRRYAQLRRRYCCLDNPVNYALVILDIPKDSCNETAIRERFELIVPGQVAEVVLVRQANRASKLQKKLDAAVVKRETAEYVKSTKGENPLTRPGLCGCCMCWKSKVDALEYWEGEQSRLAKEIEDEGSMSKQCSAAIVVFTNKRAAALLAQANTASSAVEWSVERAPEPYGVNWGAFNVPGYQAEIRTISVAAFMIAFTLLWTIPATAIVGLFNLKELTSLGAFEWAAGILDWSPAITGLIEGLLPPVVMAVLISLIPTLFRAIVSQERLVSRATVERKTRDYFFFFTLYGSFFVIVLGGTVIKDLDAIIDDPKLLIDALANEVPAFGVFFATFILLKSLIPLPLALSGIIRCILRFILLKLAKTERQKRKARSGGNLFQYFRFSGQAMLILFICIMFTSFSPIAVVSGVAYFGLAYLTFRYQILYATHQPWDGGGFLFVGSFWGTIVGLVLKQLVTIAVLGLKKAPAQAIVSAIPMVCTVFFTLLVKKRYRAISDHGSLHDMYGDSAKIDEIPMTYNGIYEQPAGHITEYENLNGVEEVKDVYSDVSYDEGEGMDGLQSEHHDDNVGYVPDRAAGRAEV